MQYDTSALVRKNIVEKITLTSRILPSFIERVKDIESTIRIAVFKKISDDGMGPTEISLEDRRFLLKNGLNDRYGQF